MRVHLLHPDRDPDLTREHPAGAADLVRDLGLDQLVAVMGGRDDLRRAVVEHVLLSPVTALEDVRWRQEVLTDFLAHPEAATALHDLAVEGLESQRQIRGWYVGRQPTWVLGAAVKRLGVLRPPLQHLRDYADAHADAFASPGLRGLMATIRENLTDEYLADVDDHLVRLELPTGVVMTASLGAAGKSRDIVLRKPADVRRGLRDWLRLPRRGELSYTIPDRDEAGMQALNELTGRALNRVADAAAQAVEHILAFFTALRRETAFYVGCLALRDALEAAGHAVTVPDVRPVGDTALEADGLYDPTLVLASRAPVTGNALHADGARAVVITGANQGGKSTFLRSIGLAQVMMRAGMFVAAGTYRSGLTPGVHTHFAREEDATLERGKLDEELDRMSRIADRVRAGDLVLFNESFSCTNEREGSAIARVVVDALGENGVRVAFVTHMYDLAHGLVLAGRQDLVFLRPERLDDGSRTFRLVPGEPLRTSFGEDLYDRVIGSG